MNRPSRTAPVRNSTVSAGPHQAQISWARRFMEPLLPPPAHRGAHRVEERNGAYPLLCSETTKCRYLFVRRRFSWLDHPMAISGRISLDHPPSVPAKRRTQTERVAESSERLLLAAAELTAEKGFERTTSAEIGERAGYSRAMVRGRYGSKEALIEALF